MSQKSILAIKALNEQLELLEPIKKIYAEQGSTAGDARLDLWRPRAVSSLSKILRHDLISGLAGAKHHKADAILRAALEEVRKYSDDESLYAKALKEPEKGNAETISDVASTVIAAPPKARNIVARGPLLIAQPMRKIIDNRYEIIDLIGKGGMGEVLRVKDRQTEIEYALKQLHPAFDSMESVEDIKQNFALVSCLTHPNIVCTRYLGFEQESKRAYLILDLIEGPNLEKWLESQKLPISYELATQLASQISNALDYAYEFKKVVHCDVKPANILIRNNNKGVPEICLTDYGLAAQAQASLHAKSLTNVHNSPKGTAAYMSPEQIEGKTLTRGVDQWALGVVFYEMIAGQKPFIGPNFFATTRKITDQSPEKPRTITDEQWAVLQKALSKDREKRYDTCTEFTQALMKKI